MAVRFRWALIAAALAGCLGLAQTRPAKGPAPAANEAEARFADGSVVRVQILQPALEVQTHYGKLTVPVGEIRRIEFGLHLTEAVRQRIDEAVKKLGSEAYRDREKAVLCLAGEGVPAVPALLRASKSTDLEVARRAETALEKIRTKSPEEARRLRSDDLIETTRFPVVGRIVTPVLKARSGYFGDVDLRLPELRQLRFQGALGDRGVVVDAARYGSAPGQWMDSGYDFTGHGRLKITAKGQVDLWPQTPGQYTTGPKGYTGGGTTAGALPGTLLGRIGETGTVFPIGESYEAEPGERGRLYLHIVPSPWNNASTGSYRVRVTATLLAAGLIPRP
jgi:hypothetical protein